MDGDDLKLIEPTEALADEYVAYIEEFAGEGQWYLERRDDARCDFAKFVQARRDSAAGRSLKPGRVPRNEYWLVRGRKIVGVVRLGHTLTPALEDDGGHIGYEVRPSERGKGNATRMLAMALDKARERGLERVLLTCHQSNAASIRVIEKNGGKRASEGVSKRDGGPIYRYWIEL